MHKPEFANVSTNNIITTFTDHQPQHVDGPPLHPEHGLCILWTASLASKSSRSVRVSRSKSNGKLSIIAHVDRFAQERNPSPQWITSYKGPNNHESNSSQH